MRLFLFIAAIFAAGTVASVQPAYGAQSVTSEAVRAELSTFGRWMVRLNEIQQPVEAELSQLGPQWQAAAQAGPPRAAETMRPFISGVLTRIDRANAELLALETPTIGMDFPAEIQPGRLRADTLRLNRELRVAIEGFGPVLDAMGRNDSTAALNGVTRLLETMRLVIESRIALTRGMMAATPREEPAWETQNIYYILLRASSRALLAWPSALAMRSDPGFVTDLNGFSDELESTVEIGERKFEEIESDFSAHLTVANESGDRAATDVLRRSLAVMRIQRRYFPIGRRLAALLREQASHLNQQPLTAEALLILARSIQTLRTEIEDVERQSALAIAGAT